jgi:hypothetical protein
MSFRLRYDRRSDMPLVLVIHFARQGETDMDVGSLKNELEEHLKKNTDEHAPHGFRDRFEMVAVELEAAGDEGLRSALEAQLHQIRAEAEAAAKCCAGGGADDEAEPVAGATRPGAAASAREAEPAAGPPASASTPGAATADPEISDMATEPSPGFLQRFGLPLLVALIVVVALLYYFR